MPPPLIPQSTERGARIGFGTTPIFMIGEEDLVDNIPLLAAGRAAVVVLENRAYEN